MPSDAHDPNSAPTTPPQHGNPTPQPTPPEPPTPPRPPRALAPLDPPTSPEVTPPQEQGPPPRLFGRYELLAELAHGGMGVVHRARDTSLGRTVALKRIRGGFSPAPDDLLRFDQEARAAARLDHPHIVPVYEIGWEEGQHYFTMKLAEGGNLNQHRRRFFNDPRAAVRLLAKVARAIHCAHESGILHRDLKPANVLLDEHDEPLVTDFGLAKVLDASTDLTHTGQVLGTPGYMAPEQAAGRTNAVSARTDVWALGVILYELVTGRRPFPGHGRDEVINQILSSNPPTLRSLRPELDAGLEAVVLKCLEKESAQRYASAEALADDLESWAAGRQPRVRPRGPLARLVGRARRQPLVLLGATLALALGALAAVVFGGPDPEEVERVRREAARRKEFLEPLQKQLAEGHPVTLIGATGEPAWWSWALVEGKAGQAVSPGDKIFKINAWDGVCLLELLSDPQLERYRIRAEVEHYIAPQTRSEVGIYAGDSVQRTRQGEVHTYVPLVFNDGAGADGAGAGKPLPSDVKLRLEVGWKDASDKMFRHEMAVGVAMPFTPHGGRDRGRPWHPIAIEVTPDAIRAFWDGKPMGAATRTGSDPRLQKGLDSLSANPVIPKGIKPSISPRGGLGLYAYSASARFRNVVVEPLKEGRSATEP